MKRKTDRTGARTFDEKTEEFFDEIKSDRPKLKNIKLKGQTDHVMTGHKNG